MERGTDAREDLNAGRVAPPNLALNEAFDRGRIRIPATIQSRVSGAGYFTLLRRGSVPLFNAPATRPAICVAPDSVKCVPSVGVANSADLLGTVW